MTAIVGVDPVIVYEEELRTRPGKTQTPAEPLVRRGVTQLAWCGAVLPLTLLQRYREERGAQRGNLE